MCTSKQICLLVIARDRGLQQRPIMTHPVRNQGSSHSSNIHFLPSTDRSLIGAKGQEPIYPEEAPQGGTARTSFCAQEPFSSQPTQLLSGFFPASPHPQLCPHPVLKTVTASCSLGVFLWNCLLFRGALLHFTPSYPKTEPTRPFPHTHRLTLTFT